MSDIPNWLAVLIVVTVPIGAVVAIVDWWQHDWLSATTLTLWSLLAVASTMGPD